MFTQGHIRYLKSQDEQAANLGIRLFPELKPESTLSEIDAGLKTRQSQLDKAIRENRGREPSASQLQKAAKLGVHAKHTFGSTEVTMRIALKEASMKGEAYLMQYVTDLCGLSPKEFYEKYPIKDRSKAETAPKSQVASPEEIAAYFKGSSSQ